ncbi:MAG: putative hydrolase of the superfamily [Actinomycetota bacterium]|jgi:putative hydrolase of the HAD superfamily|nr:putative hydrolase of the superfamily [Actinomycetota bacterium]
MSEQGPVTAVWTDFGGVLTPPVGESLAKFCAGHGLTQDEFLGAVSTVSARYGTSDILEPLDTPLVDEQEWLRQVSEVLGRPIGVRSFGEAWFDDRPANHDWVETLRAVRRRGVGVSVMSNMVPSWDEHWRRMVDVDELFDHVVLSFEVGCRKPDKKIFELAASRAQARPDQCVLIDDVEKNCAAARVAGWHAIDFFDAQSAAGQLWTLVGGQPE